MWCSSTRFADFLPSQCFPFGEDLPLVFDSWLVRQVEKAHPQVLNVLLQTLDEVLHQPCNHTSCILMRLRTKNE